LSGRLPKDLVLRAIALAYSSIKVRLPSTSAVATIAPNGSDASVSLRSAASTRAVGLSRSYLVLLYGESYRYSLFLLPNAFALSTSIRFITITLERVEGTTSYLVKLVIAVSCSLDVSR
jgi:hypothetical protein